MGPACAEQRIEVSQGQQEEPDDFKMMMSRAMPTWQNDVSRRRRAGKQWRSPTYGHRRSRLHACQHPRAEPERVTYLPVLYASHSPQAITTGMPVSRGAWRRWGSQGPKGLIGRNRNSQLEQVRRHLAIKPGRPCEGTRLHCQGFQDKG